MVISPSSLVLLSIWRWKTEPLAILVVGPADFLIGRLADDESGATEGGEGPMETETAAGADTFLSLTGEEGELTSRVLTFLSLLILVTDVVIVDIDEESACLDLLHSMFDGGCDVDV